MTVPSVPNSASFQTAAPGAEASSTNRSSYCFNRDCAQPKNSFTAKTCDCCGEQLLLKNRYRAVQLIGQGGFGRTFKGVDMAVPQTAYCAIKQFWVQSNSYKEDKAAALFEQEAQRLAVLGKHRRIPALLDFVVEPHGQYLVQEFVKGPNLAQKLATDGRWNEKQVRQLLEEMLVLLQFVHQRNHIIHRDIKPENIIQREQDGALVLVDFGASKLVTEASLGMTGTVIGSAAYTAPEQVRGKAIFASDLYSLGVTCIHLLTQVPPFTLHDSGEDGWKWRQYLQQPVSKQLGAVLDNLLAGATNRRYGSAEVALRELYKPKTKRKVRRTLLAASVSVLALLGARGLVAPLARQVASPVGRTVFPSTPYESEEFVSERAPSEPGGLFSTNANGEERAFPLENTSVTARVAGNLSRVEVTQTFTNPYDNPLEAVYKFPLPDDAAVDDMEIRIGDRIIRGLIKEREEAQQIYEEAKEAGQTAGLLEQEKANIFTQSLANIRPGETIEVVIRYSNSLEFVGGDYEFVFPMVVAPRFEPGDLEPGDFEPGDIVGGVSPAIAAVPTAASIAQTNNPPYLPENRSGQDIDVTVEIDAGVDIANVQSPSHDISAQQSGSMTRVQLTNGDTIPNKDLILRYQVMGAETQATVLTQSNEQGGHFSTYLIPAVEYAPEQVVPKDVVFLVDTSGSQSGEPIEQSQELMRQFINGLNPDDTFTIIDFGNESRKLSREPLENTRENRARALRYINRLRANGGTQLMGGIDTVLSFPEPEGDRLRSVVLLSDGLIGNDEEIIARVRDNLKPGNRLYSFGVGYSTNQFVMDRLAEVGRGTVTIVPPTDDAVEISQRFFQEINNPVVTNIEVDWVGEGDAPELYPTVAPDLFASQPLVLHGRKEDASSGQLVVTGTVAGGAPYREVLDVEFGQVSGNGAIAQQWGRARIRALMNEMYGYERPDTVAAVTQTALAYNLLSNYTAFVAVSEEVRVDPSTGVSEEVAVELPEGMTHNTGMPNAAVPEPSTIIGNLLIILFLLGFFSRKKWTKFSMALLKKPS
ncbi:MAG: VIT domain-containing protein [Cyanobacteria bacterium J06643_4]